MINIFRVVDMQSFAEGVGVLLDFKYKIINKTVKAIDISAHNIINNIVGEALELDSLYKVAFISNLLPLIQEEHDNQ